MPLVSALARNMATALERLRQNQRQNLYDQLLWFNQLLRCDALAFQAGRSGFNPLSDIFSRS